MFEGKEVSVILANAGSGKGNWVECVIPTPKGKMRFGDLKEGDYIFDRLGKPTKVLKVYDRGMMDCYKVTLSDGRFTFVSLDHLWNVYTTPYVKTMKTMTLEDMMKTGLKRPCGKVKFYIPSHHAQEYKYRETSRDPFEYGKLVAEGKLKGVPNEFKYNSVSVREEFLEGVYSIRPVKLEFRDKNTAYDIAEILNGLGKVARVLSYGDTYEVRFNEHFAGKTLGDRVAVKDVEYAGERYIRCIYVDNEEHLYQCDDGIVTHNTHKILEMIEQELTVRRPEEIAFVTYTKKGADEGLRRACNTFGYTPDDLPYFRTLHSLTYRALSAKGGQSTFNLAHEKAFNRKYGRWLNRCDAYKGNGHETKDTLYLEYYDLARSGSLTSKQLAEADIDIGYYTDLVHDYEEYKADECLVDFADCLIRYAEEGDSLPCKVAFVDEAQDITALQWQVIERAFKYAEKIVICGDTEQSIFKYSGARPDMLITLAEQYNVSYLPESYRIPRKVYDFAKSIVGMIGEKAKKPFNFHEGNPEGMIVRLDEAARLRTFVHCPEREQKKAQWYLLARNNCFLAKYKEVLEDACIPYWDADGFFMGGSVMQRLHDYYGYRLRGYKTPEKKEEFMRKYHIEDFSKEIYETALFPESRKYVYQSYIDVFGFDRLYEMFKWKQPQILVSTVHHVKGGEAENVAMLLDMTSRTTAGMFDDIDEELRILYVAVTRAMGNLYLINSSDGSGYDNIVSAIKDENGLVW